MSSAFSLQVLRLRLSIHGCSFLHSVPGSGDMDLLALLSPCLLQIGEETLVFSISARLAVIGSLTVIVVWPEVIHDTGAGSVEGNPVRAHSFRSISPSVAFHRNWSVSSVLEAATWGTNSIFASFILHVFTLVPFVAAGARLS